MRNSFNSMHFHAFSWMIKRWIQTKMSAHKMLITELKMPLALWWIIIICLIINLKLLTSKVNVLMWSWYFKIYCYLSFYANEDKKPAMQRSDRWYDIQSIDVLKMQSWQVIVKNCHDRSDTWWSIYCSWRHQDATRRIKLRIPWI